MNLADEIRKIIKGDVENSEASLEKYSRDASLFVIRPEVVVFPKDAEDVSKLVAFVSLKKKEGEHVSLTARAAGTDMSGGPINNSIIMDFTRHMNKFLDLGTDYAVVEPGMFYRDFDKKTKEKGLQLPSYTASRELCAVGGMVANNSGGEKNLKYGKTARYVEEAEVVLSDGTTTTLKRFSGQDLLNKLSQPGLEGDLYRKIKEITDSQKGEIENARPKVSKNSSGYALWDVLGDDGSIDLSRLVVGSQGTLCFVTKIKFKLVRPEPYSAMTVVMLKNLDELGDIIDTILASDPDSFESYDDKTFALAAKYFPEFAAQMKAGIVSLGFSFLPEVLMMLTGGIPKLVLMAEFHMHTQKEAFDRAVKAMEEIKSKHPNVKVRVAENEKAARKYWTIRRESFSLLRKKIRGKRTAPFIDDFVVPPHKLSEFLPKLNKILAGYDLTYTIAGHVGDGNFHIIPLLDPEQKDAVSIIDKLSHQVYDLVLEYQGSITGEHNDGLIRAPYVEKMFGSKMYSLFKDVKNLFDPLNIMNPGKKIGGTFEEITHLLDLKSVQDANKVV